MALRRAKTRRATRLLAAGLCLCAVAAVCLAGCKSMNLRGDNFNDEFANWGESKRPAGKPGQMWSFSTQGQQLERNLGVR
jgi:hypothetical protein